MQFLKGLCLFGLSFGLVFCAACFASAQEVSFVSNPVWLSTSKTTEGETVQASTVITKSGADTVRGTVEFFSNGASIGSADFSLPSDVGGTVVAVSFVPSPGTHLVSAKVTRATIARDGAEEAVSVSGEAKAGETLVIEPDNDRDAIPDATDADDDNDGVSDADETKNGTDPKKKEAASGSVAGTTTGAALDDASAMAKNAGTAAFAKTEDLRTSIADYFDDKLSETAAVRAEKQEAAKDIGNIEDLVVQPRGFTDQLKDTSGILEGLKLQVYKIGSFVFSNAYVFYIILILFVLWILRRIWKRFSLD